MNGLPQEIDIDTLIDREDPPNQQPENWASLGLLQIWEVSRDWFNNIITITQKTKYLIKKFGELDKSYEQRLKEAHVENYWKESVQAHSALLNSYSINPESPEYFDDEDAIVNLYNSTLKQWDYAITEQYFRDGTVICGVAYNGIRPYFFKVPIMSVQNVEYFGGESSELRRFSFEVPGNGGKKKYLDFQMIAGGVYLIRWIAEDGMFTIESISPLTGANDELLTEIPIAALSVVDKLDFSEDNYPLPFLYPLLEQNIKAFNKESEIDTVETKLNLPTIVRYWATKVPKVAPPLFIGASRVIEHLFPGKLEYLEPQGNGIQITHERQKHREKKLLAGQERLFNVNPDGVEKTATQSLLDATQSKRILEQAVANKKALYIQLFRFWAIFSDPEFNLDDNLGMPNRAGGLEFDSTLEHQIPSPEDVDKTILASENLLLPEQALARLLRIGWLHESDLKPSEMITDLFNAMRERLANQTTAVEDDPDLNSGDNIDDDENIEDDK